MIKIKAQAKVRKIKKISDIIIKGSFEKKGTNHSTKQV